MAQDSFETLLKFLYGEGQANFEWLPEIVTLLPPPLLGLAVQIAEAISESPLKEELLSTVEERLSLQERAALWKTVGLSGRSPARPLIYRVPEGKRVSLAFNSVEVIPYDIPVLINGYVVGAVSPKRKRRYEVDLGKEMTRNYVHEIKGEFPGTIARRARLDLYVKAPKGRRFPDLRLTPNSPSGYLQFKETALSEDAVRDYGRRAGRLLTDISVNEQKRFLEEVLELVKKRETPPKFTFFNNWSAKVQSEGPESAVKPEPSAEGDATTPPPDIPAERHDIVNLGFSPQDQADRYLDKTLPLACDRLYYFWFNIGRPLPQSIGTNEPIHVERLPKQAQLRVALFGFENELHIEDGADMGVLRIQPDSSVVITQQALPPQDIALSTEAPPDVLQKFLFFRVRTPVREGSYRLRCNVYCEQLLIRSHLITALVESDPVIGKEAFTTTVDYTLSQTLNSDHLEAIAADPHRLSLMLNSNGDGSFTFRLLGKDDQLVHKDNALIDGSTMKSFLEQARAALHRVSWGNEEAWTQKSDIKTYRYQTESFNPSKLARDLAYLARAGWRIYSGMLNHLQKINAKDFEPLIQQPGTVQIALKMSPRAVLPAAVIYDYRWRPDNFEDFGETDFVLCETFHEAIESARKGDAPLEECACFSGGCALKARIDAIIAKGESIADLPPIICPSGFWGYRHSLGMPLTLDGGTHPEAPLEISYKDEPEVTACISTDKNLVERDTHLFRLETMRKPLGFARKESYRQVVKGLKQITPHLLYFYCHGGVRAGSRLPYLEIGKADTFAPEDITAEGFSWDKPSPLVFINGCHTTALDPEIALDFVSSFVQQAGASGVIGTEITIFEQLAVRFAEECLQRFLGAPPYTGGMSIGKAVRGARLELLQRGNPLGLVYIPFAVASLSLVQQTTNN